VCRYRMKGNFLSVAYQLSVGEPEIWRGISAVRGPGQVPNHQSTLLDVGNGEKASFLGDVSSTIARVPLPWIKGCDVEPRESKRVLFERAIQEDCLRIFEHNESAL
jgi:hypothetical protein